MQCNVNLLHGKNIEEESFFSLLQCKENIFFRFSMCTFYNANLFFSSHAHLLRCKLATWQRKKKHTYFFFFATTQKKVIFFLLHFCGFFWAIFVACNRLVTWIKKQKHAHASLSCYNISYVFFFLVVFLFNSFVFLVAMLLDASLNSSQGLRDEPLNDNNGTKVIERITWNMFPNSTC